MKKIMTLTALAMFVSMGAGAQTVYDATNIASKDLSGTARFVGMGGAMGALGGDIAHYGDLPLETVSVQFVPIAFFYESVRISILGIFAMPVYDITVNAYGILQIL